MPPSAGPARWEGGSESRELAESLQAEPFFLPLHSGTSWEFVREAERGTPSPAPTSANGTP